MPYEITDPHFWPGSISGLAIEKDPQRGRVVNTKYGVHLDHTDGCLIEHPIPGRVTVAFNVTGTVDGTSERVSALLLFSPDGAARLITEIAEIAVRYDRSLISAVGQRLQEMSRPEPEVQPESPVESQETPDPEPEIEAETETTNPALPVLSPQDVLVATGRLGAPSNGDGDTGATITIAA